MTMKQRVFWGFLAGLTIVLVKIIGPDQSYLRSLFYQISSVDLVFYIFISIVTIVLGAISGLFSKEHEPVKLLLFCASVPALLSTFTGERREAIPLQAPAATENRASADGINRPSMFITSAHAQTLNQTLRQKHVCNEGSFTQRFTQSAQQYLTGKSNARLADYSVVVSSTPDFDKAKRIATQIFTKDKAWAPYVGCRKPGNANYPVIIGPPTSEVEAAEWKGRFEEAQVMPGSAYLSYYEFRKPVFTPR
ncbi:MAG: hypothetical protein P1V21_02980 [Rhizobiaceae bacterium]|nr:hypothetical protein [Rhizobiaceae bacterium]